LFDCLRGRGGALISEQYYSARDLVTEFSWYNRDLAPNERALEFQQEVVMMGQLRLLRRVTRVSLKHLTNRNQVIRFSSAYVIVVNLGNLLQRSDLLKFGL
jgi:hypothetical protein